MTDTETEKRGHTPTKGQLHKKKSDQTYLNKLQKNPFLSTYHICQFCQQHFRSINNQQIHGRFPPMTISKPMLISCQAPHFTHCHIPIEASHIGYWFVVRFWQSFLTILLASKINLGNCKEKRAD